MFDDDNAAGYKYPPRRTRFQKGQSGKAPHAYVDSGELALNPIVYELDGQLAATDRYYLAER